jgi:indolepyruvate ferredoxin oxidoreductase
MTAVLPESFALGDRYGVEDGTVLLSGIQALVRVPIDQHRADARADQRTGTFICGYQGSPLGTYDLALQREVARLEEHDVHLTPGVNEELAATAVWGSQQEALGALAGRDGVVGIWYGKAPGVDRCGDVFRHANLMGAHPKGGVLVLAGDDPTSKSSTMPSASEGMLAQVNIPVLYPGSVQEILDLARHAIAMSRWSGLWVGMKVVTNIADGFGTAHVSTDRIRPVRPEVFIDGQPWAYRQGGLALPPRNLADERDLLSGRTEAARAYARVNDLNTVSHSGGPHARIGIVAAGKTARDVEQALRMLGLDDAALERAGVRVLEIRMLWPIEPTIVRRFADGLDEIIVIEEKGAFLETAVRDVLYDAADRPRVVGKRDEHGLTLVPADGELTAGRITPLLAGRLREVVDIAHPDAVAPRTERHGRPVPLAVGRAPYFCSGCPHNRSTNVPDGSVAGGGIGCHTMAATMGRSAVALTQMGGEGAEWIGRAPFTDREHIFQNIGDGTFFHSGSTAIRACVAAGVNITFKLLHNGAVAMTGGQDAAGAMPVPELTRLLDAEGVRRTIVCAEDPTSYPRDARWAPDVAVWPRDRLDAAQRTLRDVEGVTVLIYDQACAAEKRRLRKRGRLTTPGQRVFINEWVCEGCGDCGEKSNCLSVQPIDTELGRKTRIHQSSCNFDFSCLDGDCPSFLTVHETRRSRRRGEVRRAAALARDVAVVGPDDVDEPERPVVDGCFGISLTGVGGTGVVTMSQVLATAALLDGCHVSGLDQTGLSQKGGPVISHVKIATTPIAVSNAIGTGEADAYLGFDLLVAAEPRHLDMLRAGTHVVLSTSKVPTGAMVRDTSVAFPDVDGLLQTIAERADGADAHVDTHAVADGLFADHMMANPFLLGVAYQVGALPVRATSIERALELNGVAVARNHQAFRWGRRFAVDPVGVLAASGQNANPVARTIERGTHPGIALPEDLPDGVRRLVEVRVPELVAYQSSSLARDYLDVVQRVVARERAVGIGRVELSETVARYLFKVLAYKDEYEVARLSLRPELDAALEAQFPDGGKVRYRLHPPVLRALGMTRKVALGRWFRPAFRGLYAMRRVRGTAFDPFGHTKVRRAERALIVEYRRLVEDALETLNPSTYDRAVALASLPDLVRGYESIKLAGIDRFRAEAQTLLRLSP